MLRALLQGFLSFSLLICASAAETQFCRCHCDGNSLWSIESILQCQKVSDFLIATAYFSIPLELLYFVTCSGLFPFKWVLFQFSTFIVLCGMTHLLTVFTYEHHPFLLMFSLTIFKFLTALVSFATAITLLRLIPQLLKVMMRESFLRTKAQEMDRKVGIMKKQEETRWHVRMLTQEIRKSIDKHTILYTTLVELSKTLELQNCVVWMSNEAMTEMSLTHELRRRNSLEMYGHSIPIDDPDVLKIKEADGAKILGPESILGSISSGGMGESGAVAAIRMPMLKVSNFKLGTPEAMQTRYAILVLVLPKDDLRVWSSHELETVEVIADQVAIALSHAAVLEESQMMRDQLAEQNRALLEAKQKAVMATEARHLFQSVMSQGMRRPFHSILGLLSVMQQESLASEQMLVVDTVMKTSSIVSTLINDVMEMSAIYRERCSLDMKAFGLHSMIKEAAAVTRCLCHSRGFEFGIQVKNPVPDQVVGDEKLLFHVIVHMVDKVLSGFQEGFLMFRVLSVNELEDRQDRKWVQWKSNSFICVKFEISIKRSQEHGSSLSAELASRPSSEELFMDASFNMCKQFVQLMQGNIWMVPNSQGLSESTMTLVLPFQLQTSDPISPPRGPLDRDRVPFTTLPRGLRVLLADDDDINRAVTRILLKKLGCHVTSVSSGITCVSSFGATKTAFQLVVLDLHMPEMTGLEVAMRIRKLGSERHPLIVALTACDEKDMWENCRQAGMNSLIRKPVVLQTLGDELIRVLQNT